MAQAALDMVAGAGRANKQGTLGLLAKQNSAGSITTARVQQLTKLSRAHINRAKAAANSGDNGAFGYTMRSGANTATKLCLTRLHADLGPCLDDECQLLHECQCCRNHKQCLPSACKGWNAKKAAENNRRRIAWLSLQKRTHLSQAEEIATKRWMRAANPARSGDSKVICWMVKNKFDFYYEEYRTVDAMVSIVQTALDLHGNDLRRAASAGTTSFLKNVATYLTAVEDDALDELTVAEGRCKKRPINIRQVLDKLSSLDHELAEGECKREAGEGEKDEMSEEEKKEDETSEQEELEDEVGCGVGLRELIPRSYKFFYNKCMPV